MTPILKPTPFDHSPPSESCTFMVKTELFRFNMCICIYFNPYQEFLINVKLIDSPIFYIDIKLNISSWCLIKYKIELRNGTFGSQFCHFGVRVTPVRAKRKYPPFQKNLEELFWGFFIQKCRKIVRQNYWRFLLMILCPSE